jgi:hypothetical protein
MKSIKSVFVILTLSFLFVISSCKKDESFTSDGYYSGSFSYKGQVLFDALSITGNQFKEVASGGAMNQKFPCITEGKYEINGNTITFSSSKSSNCTCIECLLDGKYTLVKSGNNLIFEREIGGELQQYNLTQIKE